jgi:hypothetical protein
VNSCSRNALAISLIRRARARLYGDSPLHRARVGHGLRPILRAALAVAGFSLVAVPFVVARDAHAPVVQLRHAALTSSFADPGPVRDITTYAGGGAGTCSGETDSIGDGCPATDASLSAAAGEVVDASGNLVIAAPYGKRIRVVAGSSGFFYNQQMDAGYIYSIAGTGTAGYTGNGGLATSAELSNPTGVSIDASGNIIINDTGNDVIRVIAESTATYYGIAMTVNKIYLIAGTPGTGGYSGDGGAATSAKIQPNGVAVDSQGNVIISDSTNQRI